MIRVIIERLIAETMEPNYEEMAMRILQRAVIAPGFISGESLQDIHNPRHRMVLCKWRSLAEWEQWQTSPERKEMMGNLNLILEKDEKVTVLQSPE